MPGTPSPVVALASGEVLDRAAFEAAVRDHQRRIFRVVLAMVRDPDEADALTQDTFVRAWEHRRDFRGEAAVGTWLTRIAIHLVHDRERSRPWRFWRWLARGSWDDEGDATPEIERVPDPSADPPRALAVREDARAVWEVVARLPVRQRAAFTLRHVEDLSLEEIASAMGCEVGTVKAHLARATAAVRREVER